MQPLITLLAILSTATYLKADSFELKIVNGTDANIADFPFIVSIQFNGRHYCGGSILNENFVLTAAHCVESHQFCSSPSKLLLRLLRVKYGMTRKTEEIGQYRRIRSVTCHNYSRDPLHNDLAILELWQPIEFGPLVQPVKLPSEGRLPPVGTLLTSIGWGDPVQGAKTGMETLQKVQLPLYSDENCKKSYPGQDMQFSFCAGVPEGGISPCSGDSGGPLVLNGVQYGIVSGGRICAEPGSPGVFARVPNYVDWIKYIAKMS